MQTLPQSLIPEDVYSPPTRKRRVQPESDTQDPPMPTEQVEEDGPETEKHDGIESDKSNETKDSTETDSTNESAPSPLSKQTACAMNEDEVVITLQSESIEYALPIKELRRLCTERGLNAAGRKNELIARLTAKK